MNALRIDDRPRRGGLADCDATSSICCRSGLFFDFNSVISFSSDSTYSVKRWYSQMLLQWSVKTDATSPSPQRKTKHEHTNETHYFTVYGQKLTLFSMCGDKDVNIILIPEVLGNRFVDNQPFHLLFHFVVQKQQSHIHNFLAAKCLNHGSIKFAMNRL